MVCHTKRMPAQESDGTKQGIDRRGERRAQSSLPVSQKTFSLVTGECLNGDECSIKTYPVKVENELVYIGISENEDYGNQ